MKYTAADFSMDSPEDYERGMSFVAISIEESNELKDTPKARLYLTKDQLETLQAALGFYIGDHEGGVSDEVLKPFIQLGYMLEMSKNRKFKK